MKGLAKRTILVLVAMVIGLIGFVAIACGGDEEKPKPPATKPVTYYGELSGVEYKLVVNGSAYTLLYDSTGRAGKIAIDGNNVTLTFTDGAKEKVTGTKDGTVITITYNEAELKLYEDITYTVKFETGSGSAVSSQSVRNGKKASKPADPTRVDKYSFVGWYTDNTYKTAYNFSTQIVTGDITLYARWLPIPNEVEYTVAFDLNYAGAAKLESKDTIGGMVIDAPVPTREGYEFKGWWISMTGEKNDGAPVLSYQLKAETVLEENTTAYAVWQKPAAAGDKLPAPMVDVNEKGLSWQSVGMTANGYDVTVTGPNNYNRKKTELTTSMDINFAELPAGDYTITVFARSSAGEDKYSEPTVRVYRNKALARVSKFEVKDESLLVYNKVKNATKYNVYVECGNETHKHNPLDNGNKDNYEFANCGMREEGLNFYVEAVAEGYATSRSEVFNYDRRLDAIAQTELKYAEATETVSWKAVNKATGYVVKIGDEQKTITGTSVDLRELDEGNIKVVVRPIANNYNSPKATEITVNKKTLATPANVRIEGMLVKWDAVKTAAKYTVEIAGKTYEATGTQLDLSDKGLTLTTGTKYSVTVKSVNGNKQSINSAAVEAEYNAMSGALTYDTNSVKWQYVFGATAYDVRVNEGAVTRVTGTNSARIKLTKEGDNKVQVRWYLVGSETPSAWKELTVKAYALSYDLNGADGALATQYYAEGDEISLYAAADIATEKVGHMFNGWYTSTDDNAKRFEDDLYKSKANTKLYANWKARKYTITLNYNEKGTGTLTTKDVVFGEAYSIEPPSDITDGTLGFIGWFLSTDEKSLQYTDEVGESKFNWNEPNGLTLYAQYRMVLSFELNNGTYWVSAGKDKGAAKTITIPATYEGVKVTSIGSTAFDSARNLEILRIPASIEHIDDATFNDVISLKSIEVYDVEGANEPRYFSEEGVLFLNNTTNNGGSIDVWAYPRAKADEVYKVPYFVTDIPIKAFYCSKFSEVIIPTNVRLVKGAAFFKTENLKTVTFLADSTYDADKNGSTMYPLTVEDGAFCEAKGITKIVLPTRLADNEDGSFRAEMFIGLDALTTIEIESTSKYKLTDNGMVYVTVTGKGDKLVFCPGGMSGDVTISSNIAIVGTHAFSGTKLLTSVTIPVNVTELEKQSFAGYKAKVEGSSSTSNSNVSSSWISTVTFEGERLVGLTIGESAFGYGYVKNADGTESVASGTYSCNRLQNLEFKPGSNVARIEKWAFAGCFNALNGNIPLLSIPNSVEYIGDYAFRGCTNIKAFAFETPGSGEDIDPDKTLTTGSNIFYGCTGLTSLTLPYYFKIEEDEDGKVNDGLFAGCTNLANVYIDGRSPYLTSDNGVLFKKDMTAIYFYPSGREGVYELPESVKTIGAGVFANKTNLTGIIIHNNVTTIGEGAFKNCSELLSVEFRGTWTNDLVIQNEVFSGCKGLTTVILPNGLKSIPDSLFKDCNALVSVNIPGSVTRIGQEAFRGCSKYRGVKNSDGTWELVIPASITELGYGAFYGCEALTKVTFAERTQKLKLFTIKSGSTGGNIITETGGSSATFYNCYSLASVTLVEGMDIIAGQMFYACSDLNNVSIPTTVTYIGTQAFANCSSMTNLTFTPRTGNNPTELNFYTAEGGSNSASPFYGIKIKTLTLPRGLTRIPRYTFSQMAELEEVYIPNTVKNGAQVGTGTSADFGEAIGYAAFSMSKTLSKVEFEKGGTGEFSLGQYAFTGSYGGALESIELPANLTAFTIDGTTRHVIDNAFDSQENLTSVTIANGSTKYSSDNGIFLEATENGGYKVAYCPLGKSGEIELGYKITEIGSRSFTRNTKITKIKFAPTPNGVDELPLTIGSKGETKDSTTQAFYYLIGLLEIEFPARTKEINEYVFKYCRNLKKIKFADGCKIESIGEYAFYDCSSLNSINLGDCHKLKSLGKAAFEMYLYDNVSLKTISLPASLEEIGESAFADLANLTTVNIVNDKDDNGNDIEDANKSKLQTIGDYAFKNTGIKSIYIPNSFKADGFGTGVFANCKSLTSISIPNTISSMGGLFTNCYKLSNIVIRPVSENASISGENGLMFTVDENGSRKLEYAAPSYQGATVDGKNNVCVIPDDVVAISDNTFANNAYITEVRISTSVAKIGANAFSGCRKLEKVSFYDTTKNNASQTLIVGNSAFYNTPELASVSFPKSLSSIGDSAFQYTPKLKSVKNGDVVTNAVTFAEGCVLTTIGSLAFYGSAIDYIDLPSKLQTIGNLAFRCSSIKEIKIPNSVIEMGTTTGVKDPGSTATSQKGYVFADCQNLKTVIFVSGTGTIAMQGYMFYNCQNLETLEIKRIAELGTYFASLSGLAEVTIPTTVTTISTYAFQDCASLKHVIFEDGSACTKIDTGAFTNCTQLAPYKVTVKGENNEDVEKTITPIILPDSLVTINGSAFVNTGITEMIIPAAVTSVSTSGVWTASKLQKIKFESGSRTGFSLGTNVLRDIKTLVEVILPDDVATIGNNAFSGTKITKITIPAAVTSFGKDVFLDCDQLQEVIFETTGSGISAANKWTSGTSATSPTNAVTFQGCTSLKKVVLPKGVLHLGVNLFKGLTSLEEVELQEGLLTISEGAFYGSGIKSIKIPASVTTIKKDAFRDCTNLYARTVTNDDNTTTVVGGVTFATKTTPADLTIEDNAFRGSGITSIVLPARVTTIGSSAFEDCTSLDSVTLEENIKLTKISSCLFANTKISAITLTDKITEIGDYAFQNTKLVAIDIPSKVATIGINPFKNCALLETITVASGNTKYVAENNILYNKEKTVLCAVAIKGTAEEFAVADTVTEILEYAIYGSAITSLSVGDNVIIGPNSFANSDKLVSVVIGNGVTVDYSAFYDCDKLADVTIGANAYVGLQAFRDCDLLATVVVDVNADLGIQAFRDCAILANVTIGNNATLGDRLFENCDSLISVSATDVASIGLNMFKDCANNVTLSGADGLGAKCNGYDYKYDNDGEFWYVYINSNFGTAFKGNITIEHVVIGAGVTEIAEGAFEGCSGLLSIVMEETEDPADGEERPAFQIGNNAFKDCISLKKLVLAKRVTKIGTGSVYSCILQGSNALEEVVTPFVGNSRRPDTVAATAKGATGYLGEWYNNAIGTAVPAPIKRVTVTDSKYMPYGAFNIPTLEYVALPDNLLEVGISTIYSPSNSTYALFYITSSTSNESLKEVHLGSSLTAIPNCMFNKCAALEKIYIPKTVASTGGIYSFSGTTAISEVYYDGTIKDWLNIAFYSGTSGTPLGGGNATLYVKETPQSDYTAVSEIDLSDDTTVTAIKAYQFYGMNGVTSIKLPNTVTSYGNFAFSKCYDLETVELATPEAAPTFGTYLFQYCTSLTSVTLPNNITKIDSGVFSGCTALTSIAIPDSVTTINLRAFENCTSLDSIVIPDSVTSVGLYVFYNCTSLTTATLSSGLAKINEHMFYNCTSMTSVTIPVGVETIATGAFYNTGLTSVTIPEGVTSIGYNAFRECPDLESVSLPSTLTYIDGNGFYACTSLKSVSIPASVTTLYGAVFADCSSLESVVFETDSEGNYGIASIGNNMFWGCTALQSVIIPSTVVTLGSKVFYGWTGSKTVYVIGTEVPMPGWVIGWDNNCTANVVWNYEPTQST